MARGESVAEIAPKVRMAVASRRWRKCAPNACA